MYIRRKVFSLGEGNIDYDYNLYQALYSNYEDPIERFYSDSFREGFDFYAQKMFMDVSQTPLTEAEKQTYVDLVNKGLSAADAHEAIEKERIAKGKGRTAELESEIKELKEAANKAKTKQEGLEKSLKKWKIGAGVGAGVAGLGLGAYLYNRKKDR